jgi:outer membrane protein TolC
MRARATGAVVAVACAAALGGRARADDAAAASAPAAAPAGAVPGAAPAPAPAPAGKEPKRITAAEALARAISSPRVEAARAGVKIAESRRAEILRAFIPTIELTSVLAPLPERRGDAVCTGGDCTPDSSLFGPEIDRYGVFTATDATLIWPLSFHRILPGARAAGKVVDVAKGDVERTKGAVFIDTAKAYYGVLLLGDLIAVADDGRDKVASALKTVGEALARGDPSVTPIDRHKIEAFRGELDGRYYRAVAGRDTALSALTMLVGAVPGERFAPSEDYLAPIAVELAPLETYVERAATSRPEIGMLAAGIEARESVVAAERASLAPDFGIVGTFAFHYSNVAEDQLSPFAFDPYNHLRAGIGLGLRWSLDVGAKLARIDRAKAELAKLRAERDAAVAAIRLEVEKVYRDTESALAAVKATDAGLKSAGKWLFTVAAAFGVGTAESRDLLEALLAQGQLALSNLQATFDLNVGIVALEVAAGGDAAARIAALSVPK